MLQVCCNECVSDNAVSVLNAEDVEVVMEVIISCRMLVEYSVSFVGRDERICLQATRAEECTENISTTMVLYLLHFHI